MRFRDALEELSDLPGLRVHRSHWVMIDAVTEVRPDGRRHVAVLSCGTEVPVSRSYLGNLEIRGSVAERRGIGTAIGGVPRRIAVASFAMIPSSSGASQKRPPV
jgi:hypothetical protein